MTQLEMTQASEGLVRLISDFGFTVEMFRFGDKIAVGLRAMSSDSMLPVLMEQTFMLGYGLPVVEPGESTLIRWDHLAMNLH